MKKSKILLTLGLCVTLLGSNVSYAHHNQWADSHYNKGMTYFQSGNYKAAIQELKTASEQTLTAGYLRKLAEAYKLDKQYQNAANTYYREAELHKKRGDMNTYYATLKLADTLNSEIELFITSKEKPQNLELQKYEPSNGVYIGAYVEEEESLVQNLERHSVFNNTTGKQHAIFFKYYRYGWEFPTWWTNKMKENGAAAQLAFQPDDGLAGIKDDEYLRTFAKEAKKAGIPIFLRFASEMNGSWVSWNGNPELYKEKFRLVAQVMKEEAPNVAMVWSPSSSPKENIQDYYPGDEYVDWVGVNIYSNNFTNGNVNQPNDHDNPIDEIKYIYDLYAAKKPIMISEFGASHMSSADMKDASKFAVTKMHMLYEGIRNKYPRIKAIHWFSVNTLKKAAREERKIANYSLLENPTVLDRYSQMIKKDYFLSSVVNGEFAKTETTVPKYLHKLSKIIVSEPVELNAWVKSHEAYISSVAFKLNGTVIGYSYQYPFKVNITPEQLKSGKNKVEVIVLDANGRIATSKEGFLYKKALEKEHVQLRIGQKDVQSDKQVSELTFAPYEKNDRTLVPVRFISEQMGMQVDWDGKTKTVTVQGEGKNIKLVIGQKTGNDNGKSIAIDVAPEEKNGTTFVPVRFVSESLNLQVDYKKEDNSVLIYKK